MRGNRNYSTVNVELRARNDMTVDLFRSQVQYDDAAKLIKSKNDDVGLVMAGLRLERYGFGKWEIEGLLDGIN